MNKYLFAVLFLFTSSCFAGWHSGKIQGLDVAYDGDTITLKIEGWSRSNCTCYSSWPSSMCLDSSRNTHDFERAMILSAKARDKAMNFNIDEVSCSIRAMSEL